MAFDLLFGKTRRSWSRSSELITPPDLPALTATPSRATEAARLARAFDRSVTIRPRGTGAVVTKKWKWG